MSWEYSLLDVLHTNKLNAEACLTAECKQMNYLVKCAAVQNFKESLDFSKGSSRV